MKRVLCALLLVVGVATLRAQTRFDVTMTVDSVERQFILVRPGTPPPPRGYAVVFMFHGTSGDGERFYNNSGWKEKGESEGFVTVFPSSLEFCFLNDSGRPVRTTKWNNGNAQEEKCAGVEMKDDVHFVRRIVDTISVMLPIDHARIYASGFSNGGVFTSKLAVDASDIFAALSASAGPLNALDSAMPSRPVPFALTIGDEDRNVVETFGRPIPFNDSALFVLGGANRRFLSVLNLAEVIDRKDSTPLSITWVFNTPENPSEPSTQYSFTVMKGLDHQYPNGTNYPISAPDPLWAFFSRYTLAGVGEGDRPGPRRAMVYPNPATDYIVIDGEGDADVTIRSILGYPVFSGKTFLGEEIFLNEVPAGLYLVDVVADRERSAQTVIIR